jgi:hypothetical protein
VGGEEAAHVELRHLEARCGRRQLQDGGGPHHSGRTLQVSMGCNRKKNQCTSNMMAIDGRIGCLARAGQGPFMGPMNGSKNKPATAIGPQVPYQGMLGTLPGHQEGTRNWARGTMIPAPTLRLGFMPRGQALGCGAKALVIASAGLLHDLE